MKKLDAWFTVAIDFLEMILNLIILGVIGAQIITRTFFSYPLKFSEEVAVFAMIAMIYGGISMVEKEDSYLRVDIFLERMPKAGQNLIYIISKLCILVLIGSIILGEIELFPRIVRLTTHAAGIPYSWLHIWVIVFSVIWGLCTLLNLIVRLRQGEGGAS